MANTQQALIKRHPSLTRDQFNAHWLNNHASIVIPWFLAMNCTYYAQIHNPRLSQHATINPVEGLNLEEWDGVAEVVMAGHSSEDMSGEATRLKEKAGKYFTEVVAPDEERFLIGKSADHVKFVPPGTVEGISFVIIEDGKVAKGQDGKPVVDCSDAMKAWENWSTEA